MTLKVEPTSINDIPRLAHDAQNQVPRACLAIVVTRFAGPGARDGVACRAEAVRPGVVGGCVEVGMVLFERGEQGGYKGGAC